MNAERRTPSVRRSSADRGETTGTGGTPIVEDPDTLRGTLEAILDSDVAEGADFLLRFLSVESEDGAGVCRLSLSYQPLALNTVGSLHGGVIALLMEIAAARVVAQSDGSMRIAALRVDYLRAPTGAARCEAQLLHRSGVDAHVDVGFWDGSGRRCATASAVFVPTTPPTELSQAREHDRLESSITTGRQGAVSEQRSLRSDA